MRNQGGVVEAQTLAEALQDMQSVLDESSTYVRRLQSTFKA